VASPESCVRPALQPSASAPHAPAPGRPGRRRGRSVRRSGAALLLGAVASLTVALLPGAASAAPPGTQATTPEEATKLVADANHDLEVVTEQLNDARDTLAQQQAAADNAGMAVADAQAQLAALDGQMRQIARSAFTGENLSRFNALMTSGSADEFLAQVNTLDAIAGHTDEMLAQVTAAAQAATQAKADADAAAAQAAQTLTDVSSQQAGLTAEIADYQAQYDSLSAAQKQQVVEEDAGPALQPPASVEAPTDAAQAAVNTALAQLGDPYVWAAAGPNAFDCSGLTQYAYAAAGVTLPHSSSAQSKMGTAVSRAQLQPGDLVFFYSPVSHVGMYIGNGQMVHASTAGSPVLVSSVDMAGYVGARRFVG
jgi:cell wall-associated NlpC family hydrolase